MKTFKLLSRNFSDGALYLNTIKAKDEFKAWEIVEESYQSGMSQDWLMTLKEFKELKELLK